MIDSYIHELEARGLSKNTIKAYRLVLTALNEYKLIETITKDDLIQFFKNLKGTDSTRQLYAVITKTYFKSIGKPETASWLKVKKPQETLRSDQVLNGEDINMMIDATDSDFWKCLIAIYYDSGGRAMEVLMLKYSDFLETNEGIVLTITTRKTAAGFRKMLIPRAEQYFRNLRDSTAHKSDDYVFNPGCRNIKTVYRHTFEVIKEIGRRARITKPVNLKAFRHARATDEVRANTQEAIIRKKLGWTPTSAMIARYQHLNDNSIIESQIGNKITKRTELKIAEKVDVVPIYETLREENKALKGEIEALKSRKDEEQILISQLLKHVKKNPKLLDILGAVNA